MTNIFIANLDWEITSSDLQVTFSAFGEVHLAHVVFDAKTKKSKGFGYVEMVSAEEAIAAIQALNGFEVNGRKLDVKIASPKANRPKPEDKPKTFAKKPGFGGPKKPYGNGGGGNRPYGGGGGQRPEGGGYRGQGGGGGYRSSEGGSGYNNNRSSEGGGYSNNRPAEGGSGYRSSEGSGGYRSSERPSERPSGGESGDRPRRPRRPTE